MTAKAAADTVRLVTAQSGRSFRMWKISAWLTLAMINVNIAEQKGRGKVRWGLMSLISGPLATGFLTFSTSYAYLSGNPTTPTPQTFTKDQPTKTSIQLDAPATTPRPLSAPIVPEASPSPEE